MTFYLPRECGEVGALRVPDIQGALRPRCKSEGRIGRQMALPH